MGFDLSTYLPAKQILVEGRLQELLDRDKGCAPSILLDAMRYSLLAPGKRLRPCLVFMAADLAGGNADQACPAACAVEMIHTYSLIHDDLPAMDDDDLRRGQPTCHRQFGEALAILAGDALLTIAFEVLAGNFPARTAAACCKELAKAAGAAGMVGGQVEDLAWERSDGANPDPRQFFPRTEQPHTLAALEHIHRLKTGALFQACLRLGLLSAQGERERGADAALMNALSAFGQNLGMIFQITDDLLDVEGSVADTGKQVGKDAARGKLTYPSLLGVTESRSRARALADDAQAELAPWGQAAAPLVSLLRYILERNR